MIKTLIVLLLLLTGAVEAGVIYHLPATNRIIALTFDACETRTPAYFDDSIVNYLTNQKIPFTLFVSGRFARRNASELKAISRLCFAEIESHSMNHSRRMTNMSRQQLLVETISNGRLLERITGRTPKYFRFPYGFFNPGTLQAVEEMGYQAIQFSFASGDPDPKIPGWKILKEAVALTRPGSILIFHINGRGWLTGKILPELVGQLREKGYRFVRLDEGLK